MKQISFQLKQNTIHLWKINLGHHRLKIDDLTRILSPAEIKRAELFHCPQDRAGFKISHLALRLILSKYLSERPELLEFSTNDFGKPFLKNSRFNFNLSHSGELALVAIAENLHVGVDVELIRAKINYRELADRFFSKDEKSYLQSFYDPEAKKEFFRLWVRKEAFVKAKGCGLSEPLENFSVINAETANKNLFSVEPSDSETNRWWGSDLTVAENYVAAVVSHVEFFETITFQFNSLI